MPALNPTRQNALLLVVLLFAQLLMMAGSARGERGSTALERGVTGTTRPFVSFAGSVGGAVRGAVDGVREMVRSRQENARLRSERDALRAELLRLEEQAHENVRLRRLLGMRDELVPQGIAASVVGAARTDREQMIVIDRGTDHGVHPDLPAVAWGGAVGRVVFADERRAKVRLLIDPNSGVAGVLQRTRVEGMVQGQGEPNVVPMLYVPKFSDVMLGDRVVTSGLDGVFPRGIGIGRVVFVGEDTGVSKVILLSPEVDFSALEELLVLLEPVGGPLLAGPR